MRTSWLIGALVAVIIGYLFSITIIGAIIGVPLILLGLFLLIVGIFLPEKKRRKEVIVKEVVRETVQQPVEPVKKANFCSNCGAKVKGKFCSKCGESI